MAGLFRPESDFDDGTIEEPTPSDPNITGVFRAFYLASGESSPLCDLINLDYSAADCKTWRTGIRGAEANIKSEGRKINRLRFDALVQILQKPSGCESASQKPSGCGATAFNDQAVGLLDWAVSKPTQLPFPGPNIRCLSAYAY